MSTFQIGYQNISRKSAITGIGFSDDYPAPNVGLGGRRLLAKENADHTDTFIDFDLGAGITEAASFLYIARANLLSGVLSDMTVGLYAGSNGISYSEILADSAISDYLVGPRNEDFLRTFTLSDAHRYWQLVVRNPASDAHEVCFSKVMFGTSFDFGRNPDWGRQAEKEILIAGKREIALILQYEWAGITDLIIKEFFDEIGNFADVQSVVLWDTGDSDPYISDFGAIHCKINKIEVEKKSHNCNTIAIKFQELI